MPESTPTPTKTGKGSNKTSTSSKRQRKDGDDGVEGPEDDEAASFDECEDHAPEEHYSKAEVDALLDQLSRDINGHTDKALGEMRDGINSATARTIRAIDKAHTDRCNELSAEVAGVGSRCAALESDHREIWDAIRSLRKGLSSAESAVRGNTTDAFLDEWDAPPDPAELVINCRETMGRLAIISALEPLIDLMAMENLPDGRKPWKIMGGRAGSRFQLVFLGEEGLAARRARKFIEVGLKDESGEWKEVTARNARGESKPLFIGPSKSKKQNFEEGCLRKMGAAVKELRLAAGKDAVTTWIQKTDLVLYLDEVPLVHVFAEKPGRPQWTFGPTRLAELGISREACVSKYEEFARTSRRQQALV